MGCALIHPPQAYWKKSSQGAAAASIESASTPAGRGGAGACASEAGAAVAAGAGAGGAVGAAGGGVSDAPHATARAVEGIGETRSRRRVRETSGAALGTR